MPSSFIRGTIIHKDVRWTQSGFLIPTHQFDICVNHVSLVEPGSVLPEEDEYISQLLAHQIDLPTLYTRFIQGIDRPK